MRFGKVIASLVLSIASVVGAEAAAEEKQAIKFVADYIIQEFPDIGKADVAQLNSGKNIHLEYTVGNMEEEDINVIGVGGVLTDPATGAIKVNLTSGAIGPIVVANGESKTFVQDIPLDLVADNYLLNPQVYIVMNDVIKMIPVRGQLATVTDLPISWFNPQFLFLMIVLTVSFVGLGFAAYDIWGKRYLKGTSPIQPKQRPASTGIPSVYTSGSKTYDESWLPEHHLQKKKRAN